MKIGLMIAGDIAQVMLIPETPAEEAALSLLREPREISVKHGKAYVEKRNGLIRMSDEEMATFIVLRTPAATPERPPETDEFERAPGEISRISKLVKEAKAVYDAMSPEEKAAHDKAQRESFVRGMMPTGDPRLD